MPYQIQKKPRGKMVGLLTVVLLGTAAITGTTYANLTTKTLTEADSEYVKSEFQPNFRFNYYHAEDSEPIEANVTPSEAVQTLTFVKKITNDSALPAHAVLYAEGFDAANIPAVLLDNVKVQVSRSDLGSGVFQVTLREFLSNGILFERIIAPDVSFTHQITFSIPTSASADFTSAVGNFEEKFSTGVTFSQAINNVSPLLTHYSKTGNHIRKGNLLGGAVYLIDKSALATVVGEKP